MRAQRAKMTVTSAEGVNKGVDCITTLGDRYTMDTIRTNDMPKNHRGWHLRKEHDEHDEKNNRGLRKCQRCEAGEVYDLMGVSRPGLGERRLTEPKEKPPSHTFRRHGVASFESDQEWAA